MGETMCLVLGTPPLSSQRTEIKGLPGTMGPADHDWFIRSFSFGITHSISTTSSQTQKQTGISWMVRTTKDRPAHSGTALFKRQLS